MASFDGKSCRILLSEVFSLFLRLSWPPFTNVSGLDVKFSWTPRGRAWRPGIEWRPDDGFHVFHMWGDPFAPAGGNPSRAHLHFVVCVRRRLKLHQVRSIERLGQVGKNAAVVKVLRIGVSSHLQGRTGANKDIIDRSPWKTQESQRQLVSGGGSPVIDPAVP